MDIKVFVQGESDRTLFGLVGPWLADRHVHLQQGAPITSEPGDIWHVAMSGRTPIGFAVTHLRKSQAGAHIRFLFADAGHESARSCLLAAVLHWLKEHDIPVALTFAREDDPVWSTAGFALVKRHEHKSFHTWQREIATTATA